MRQRSFARSQVISPISGSGASLLLVLIVVAVLLGGGHIFGSLRNGLIEVVAFAALLKLSWDSQARRSLPRDAQAPLFFFLALFTLLLLQITPLAPQGLPGREAVDTVIGLTAPKAAWHRVSLYPAATARFAMSLTVPLAVCLLTINSTDKGRFWAIRAVAVLAGVSALLGMAQVALGSPDWMSPFGLGDEGTADGLFVNRNHHAMFMLCGLLTAAHWIAVENRDSKASLRLRLGRFRVHAAWLLFPLLTVVIIATGSKAGVGLLLVVLPAATLIALPSGRERVARSTAWPAVFAALTVLFLIVFLILPLPPSELIRSRLILKGDARLEFLPDLLLLLHQFWPLGSGAGTFVPVYKLIEDLDKLGPAYLNHAHNDFIEWLIETGLPGLVLLIGGIILLTARLFKILRANGSFSRKLGALTGLAVILVLAMHSAIDYPLRTDALAAVFGLALGMIYAPPLDIAVVETPAVRASRSTGRILLLSAISLIGLAGALQMMRLRVSEAAADDANAPLAKAIGASDGFAQAYVAEATLNSGQNEIAKAQALEAIRSTPLTVVAVRVLAMADARLNDFARARLDWRAAALLGWRDLPTQYWAMKQALRDGELPTAGMRADAVLRLSAGDGPFVSLVRQAVADPRLRQALIPRLRLKPNWRTPFLNPGRMWTDSEMVGILPLARQLQQGPSPATMVETRDVILTLLNEQRWSEALAMDAPFAAHRQPDPGSLLDDGGFAKADDRYAENSSPFEWYRGSGAALEAAPPTAMVINTDGPTGNPTVSRWVALAPGRYGISYRTRGPVQSGQSLGMIVLCPQHVTVGISPREDLPTSDDFVTRKLAFDVPANCPVVILGIGPLASAPASEAEFDDIRLWRVQPAASTTR